jgi:DNA-binding transcriptional MerR regulator
MGRKSTISSNRWGIRQKVLAETGIARDQLMAWAEAGVVRTAKLGNGQQGRRVFCVDDILAALERIAIGLKPENRRR